MASLRRKEEDQIQTWHIKDANAQEQNTTNRIKSLRGRLLSKVLASCGKGNNTTDTAKTRNLLDAEEQCVQGWDKSLPSRTHKLKDRLRNNFLRTVTYVVSSSFPSIMDKQPRTPFKLGRQTLQGSRVVVNYRRICITMKGFSLGEISASQSSLRNPRHLCLDHFKG